MDLLQLLAGQMQAQQVAQRVGARPDQVRSALQAAAPLLLGALTRNAQQGAGPAAALEQAVAQHGAEELDNFARAGQLPDMQGGQAALGHIFGAQQDAVVGAVSRRSGLDPQLALQILSVAAPLVLSYLNQRRQGGNAAPQIQLPGQLPGSFGQPGAAAPAGADIVSVLTGVLGGALGGTAGGALGGGGPLGGAVQPGAASGLPGGAGNLGGLLGTLNRALDRDGDGSALDEVMDMFSQRR